MDRDWLTDRLDRGLSLEAMGRESGKHPSTVAYWLAKHGLEANGRATFAPRGGLSETDLTEAMARSKTLGEIAERLGVSISTVRYWLRRYRLAGPSRVTRKQAALRARAEGRSRFEGECSIHGPVEFLALAGGRSRCSRCNCEAVSKRRRVIKATLVDEAGGSCSVCGYSRCPEALQFHHVDPALKRWALSAGGVTRALDRSRAEAAKCLLLCANCHAEVEAGVTKLA